MPKAKSQAKARQAAKSKVTSKPSKAKTLAPRTKSTEPNANRPLWLRVQQPAGVRVNEDTAMTLNAVYSCVKVISEDISKIPCHVMEKQPGGGSLQCGSNPREPLYDPAEWLVSQEASPLTSSIVFREVIISHALTWGNGYAEIERSISGAPTWLWLLTPDRVTPRLDGSDIVYEVRNPIGSPSFIPSADMLHIRGLGFDGLMGYSVIQLAARSIGAGIALDQATSDFFANDSTPGGMLVHPGRIGDKAMKRLMEDWEKRHSGANNRRRVAVLEEGMKWEQTGLPPEDTKLLEQRQFTPTDIARWFRVMPHKIGDLSRSTFSNIEHQGIEHVTDTLLPWVRRFETECNIKLFGRTNRGKRFVRLNMNGLLRGDHASRSAFYTSMLDRGVFSINNVLALEDLNPIGPDGDKRFVQQNMQLLENAGEEPPPVAAPVVPQTDDPEPEEEEDNDEDASELRAALRPVFEDACRRMLRREGDRARSAKSVASIDDHVEYIRTTIRPAAVALALAMKADPSRLDAAIDSVASLHMDEFRERLGHIEEPKILGGWAGMLTESTTDRIMGRLIAAVEATK